VLTSSFALVIPRNRCKDISKRLLEHHISREVSGLMAYKLGQMMTFYDYSNLIHLVVS